MSGWEKHPDGWRYPLDIDETLSTWAYVSTRMLAVFGVETCNRSVVAAGAPPLPPEATP